MSNPTGQMVCSTEQSEKPSSEKLFEKKSAGTFDKYLEDDGMNHPSNSSRSKSGKEQKHLFPSRQSYGACLLSFFFRWRNTFRSCYNWCRCSIYANLFGSHYRRFEWTDTHTHTQLNHRVAAGSSLPDADCSGHRLAGHNRFTWSLKMFMKSRLSLDGWPFSALKGSPSKSLDSWPPLRLHHCWIEFWPVEPRFVFHVGKYYTIHVHARAENKNNTFHYFNCWGKPGQL